MLRCERASADVLAEEHDQQFAELLDRREWHDGTMKHLKALRDTLYPGIIQRMTSIHKAARMTRKAAELSELPEPVRQAIMKDQEHIAIVARELVTVIRNWAGNNDPPETEKV
jgi:hypothetical protein